MTTPCVKGSWCARATRPTSVLPNLPDLGEHVFGQEPDVDGLDDADGMSRAGQIVAFLAEAWRRHDAEVASAGIRHERNRRRVSQ